MGKVYDPGFFSERLHVGGSVPPQQHPRPLPPQDRQDLPPATFDLHLILIVINQLHTQRISSKPKIPNRPSFPPPCRPTLSHIPQFPTFDAPTTRTLQRICVGTSCGLTTPPGVGNRTLFFFTRMFYFVPHSVYSWLCFFV